MVVRGNQTEDYILFMQGDVEDRALANDAAPWSNYLSRLKKDGKFTGGNAIGSGIYTNKNRAGKPLHDDITRFFRAGAENLGAAKLFVHGNRVYETGGKVEIHHLPRDE